MNKDEAIKAIELSKEAYKSGNTELALRLVNKSLKLFPTDEAKSWLSALEKSKDKHSENMKPSENIKESKKAPEKEVQSSREYTAEQMELVTVFKRKDKNDYYGLLDLERSATEVEIKKSYRKLALQFHPDKNGAPGADEAFKSINKAFAVLSDSQKRRLYDITGSEDRTQTASNHFYRSHGNATDFYETEIDPEEIFNMFFREFAAQNVSQARRRRRQEENGSDSFSKFFHLLPLLILMFTSLISGLFSRGEPSRNYSYEKNVKFNTQRVSNRFKVNYYVSNELNDYINSRIHSKHFQGDIKKFEEEIETEYIKSLQAKCRQEQYHRKETPSCTVLERLFNNKNQ